MGNASPLQQGIADSFQRRQTREELNEYGQPAPPPSDHGAVRDMYEWYDDWWGKYDPWDSLDDYETNGETEVTLNESNSTDSV